MIGLKNKMEISKLKKIVSLIFRKHGLSKKDSEISTDALINAELVGAYGHGLSRLRMYCERISKGVINPKPKIKKFLHQFLILMPIIVLDLLQLISLLKNLYKLQKLA